MNKISNDYPTNNDFAFLTFKGTFQTRFGESMLICGSIEELGNWIPEKAKKLYTNKEIYPEWEMEGEIFTLKGMVIEFKFIYYNETTKEYRWETLPSNINRVFIVESAGSFIIDSSEGIINPPNYKKRKITKSFSEIKFSTQPNNRKTTFDINNNKEIENADEFLEQPNPEVQANIITNLDYESNQFSGNDFNDSFNFYLNPKMSTEDRIIIVTDYLPFEVEKTGQQLYSLNMTDESLVYSIMYRMKEINFCEVLWVGMLKNYTEFEEDELYDIEAFLEEKNIFIVIPEFLSDYNNYCLFINNIISPVFVECNIDINNSYFLNYDDYFNAYKTINQLFASRINNVANFTDLIMINDLHLMLVPNYLLSKNINSKIGIYFHKAFPSSDIIKSFPYHLELLKSILLCDVIGFHVFQFARNFLTSCKRILGIFFEIKYKGYIILPYIGRNIIIRVQHAGIDVDYIKSIANSQCMSCEDNTMSCKNINSEKKEEEKENSLFCSIIGNKINQSNLTSIIQFDLGKEIGITAEHMNKINSTTNIRKVDNKSSYQSAKNLELNHNNVSNDFLHQKNKLNFKHQLKYYEELINDRFSFASVDNYDEASSLLLKLEAYKRFLTKISNTMMKNQVKTVNCSSSYFNLENKFVYIQIVKREKYLYLRESFDLEVNELVDEIHNNFGKETLKIIFVDSFSVIERLALFKVASVLFYLQIREGHCIYISEFIAIKHILKEQSLGEKNNNIEFINGMENTTKSVFNKSRGLNNKMYKSNASTQRKNGNIENVIKKFDFGIIISENIGAPKTIKSPLRINPFHISSIVNALLYCYTMPLEEKYNRFNADIDFVINNTTFTWIKNFFIDLKRTDNSETQKTGMGIGLNFRIMKLKANFCQLNKKHLLEGYYNSGLRVFFLDYEGTLQTKDLKNEETLLGYKPEPYLLNLIAKLTSDPRNLVYIVSGREKVKLDEWFGDVDDLNLASEHGFFYKNKKKIQNINLQSINSDTLQLGSSNNVVSNNKKDTSVWEELFQIADWSWKESVLKILEGFTEKTEGSYLYKKQSIITWFYRDCDVYFGMVQANEINTHLHNIFEYCKLDIVNGKGYVEIKPKGVNKGYFVSHIIKSLISKNLCPDFIFAAGDDTSDEEMFKYLNSVSSQLSYQNPKLKIFTTTIGKKPSSANYFVNDTQEILEYLEVLSKPNLRMNMNYLDKASRSSHKLFSKSKKSKTYSLFSK